MIRANPGPRREDGGDAASNRPPYAAGTEGGTGLAAVRARLRAWHEHIGGLFRTAEIRRTDPARPLLEVMRDAPAVMTEAVVAVAEEAAARITGAAAEMEKAATASRAAAADTFRADEAKARASLAKRLEQTVDAAVATDRRLRGLRAYGLAGIALAGTFALGMATEHWRGSAAAVAGTAANVEALRTEAAGAAGALAAERRQLVEATDAVRASLADAGPAMAVFRVMGTLPQAELEAVQGIVNDLAANARGSGQSPQLAALREAMAMPAGRRRDAVEFAKIEDGGLRGNLLALNQVAAARQGVPWWQGENTYKGCLANGPVLTATNGGKQPTCLVALPSGWAAKPDTVLRNNYPANGQ